MTLSLCLVPLYSRSLPAPAPALPVRQRGAASSAKNGATDSNDPSLGRRAPKTVPPIQMTPQLGGTVLCAGPHEILERPSHRRCKRARRGTLQILLHAPCKGPARRGARASSPPDGSRAARVDPAPSRAPHAGSNHAARARRRRSTKSPRASRPRCTRRPRLPGMREAINGTQRQSVALGGMGIYGHQKLSAAISGHQRN